MKGFNRICRDMDDPFKSRKMTSLTKKNKKNTSGTFPDIFACHR